MKAIVKRVGKRLLFPTLLLLTGFCSKAPMNEPEPQGRIVLAEDFSYARCSYCPFAEEALDSLSREFGDSLAVIIYHRRMLGDTLSPPGVIVREGFYQISTSPIVVFDGTNKIQTSDPSLDYPTYKTQIMGCRSKKSPFRLRLNANQTGNTVNLVLHIIAIDSLQNSDLRIFFIAYEDDVVFIQAGAPDTIFDYVVRKMIPDENGIPLNIQQNDSTVQTAQFNLSDHWHADKMGLVAFIQDMTTKEVLQAMVLKKITTREVDDAFK